LKTFRTISSIKYNKMKIFLIKNTSVCIQVIIIAVIFIGSCDNPNSRDSSLKKNKIYYETQLAFSDADASSYQFTAETGRNIYFNTYFDSEYQLTIQSEGNFYPNKKLLNKRFFVKYHYDTQHSFSIQGIEDTIMSIDSLRLIDDVKGFNVFAQKDYLLAPSCSDQDVHDLILNRFYNTLASEGEKCVSLSNFKDLVKDSKYLKTECEITLETNIRLYIFNFIVKKDTATKLELLYFSKKK
jgi:hypothetical protein